MSSVETTTAVGEIFSYGRTQTFQTTDSSAHPLSLETNNAFFESTTVNIENDTNSDIIPDVKIRYHSIDALTIVVFIWVIGKN